MKEGRITEECWIELYHTCKSVLAEHGGDAETVKECIRQAFDEADEKPCDEVHELFLKAIDLIHDLEKKKAANAPTDQSEALTVTETTASGCYNNYTTAAARNQEGRNGNE